MIALGLTLGFIASQFVVAVCVGWMRDGVPPWRAEFWNEGRDE